jgi:phosphatidylglycerophosphatase A
MSYHGSGTLDLKKAFKEAGLPGKTAIVLATWFGSGLMPVASGTFGTLAGVPLVLLMSLPRPLYAAPLVFVFVVVAVWASDLSHRLVGKRDPSAVVIDEVAGLLLALFALPVSWVNLCLGFVLFRGFDIFKPFPVRNLEALRGGIGIVADDLMAGIYANLSLRLLMYVLYSS